MSALDRTERFAVQAVHVTLQGEIPGVFHLNEEGIHDACFYV